MSCTNDWPMPIGNPARHAVRSDVKRANNAAPSAGAMSSGNVLGSACAIGAARIPISPAKPDAKIALTIESWFGDNPASIP